MSLSSGDDLVPPLVLPHVPSTSVKASSDVLTLTITLKTFGTVLYPPEIATFRPANSCDDADFEAFVNICHSTEVHLHFARAQFGLGGTENPSDRVQLRQFIGDFNTSQTLPADYDLVSADNGKGLREGTWRIFLSPSALQSRTRILRKRRRLCMSNSHFKSAYGRLANSPQPRVSNSTTLTLFHVTTMLFQEPHLLTLRPRSPRLLKALH